MGSINIKSEREYLREIYTKINNGHYAIPVFQRDYVWKKEQVLDLFDSISKGYPIGTIILWKPTPQFITKSKDILTDEKKETPTPDYYVLDGRQRLTAFYGCVLDDPKKNDCFKLGYNLESEAFEYLKGNKREVLPLSDIYDTFSLLGKLQDLTKMEDTEKERLYVERAKRMNSILQSYTIGEILMSNCSLDEASIVFSRINSKGTDISKAFMLQAISYKNEGGILLSDEINNILSTLGKYNFDKLSSDDILNCFYQYVGKKFYDTPMKELENVDFTPHLSEIKTDIRRTVDFLYNDCFVLSSALLPYTKQLIALVAFFKEHKEPSIEQKKELKKWFFYTTCQQSFQNSSLSNVRFLFKRFDEFVKGDKDTAIDYETIYIAESFDFKFKINSARTDFLLLSQIYHYAKFIPLDQLEYSGCMKMKNSSPESIILYLRRDDRLTLDKILNNEQIDDEVEKFALTPNMIQLIRSNNIDEFRTMRTSYLIRIEKEFLNSMDLTVNPIGL
jgi:hypothetical protein